MKYLKNAGFTLTEIMVSMALLGGISIVTMRMMENHSEQQKRLVFQSDVGKMHSTLVTTMNNPGNCTLMFQSLVPSPTGLIIPNLSLTKPATSGTNTITFLRSDLPINQQPQGPQSFYINTNDIRLFSPSTGTNTAELQIVYRLKKKGAKLGVTQTSSGDQVITKRIQFVVSLSGGQIRNCGPTVSDTNLEGRQKLCLSIPDIAIWDGANCVLRDMSCPVGTVPTTGWPINANCVPIRERLDLRLFFDVNNVSDCFGRNNWRIIRGGPQNKLIIQCY